MKSKKSKTLNLKGLVPSLEEDKEAYDGLKERTQTWIHDIGLRLPEQPMKNGIPLQPKIPRDSSGSPAFDALQLDELTRLSAELLAYHQYGMTTISNTKIEKIALQGKMDLLEAKLHVLLSPPEASKKMRIKVDPRHKKLKQKFDEVDARLALLIPLMDDVDKEMTLVSREISVRIADLENTKRENNMNRRGGNRGMPGGRRVR